MLNVTGVTVDFGSRVLFDNITFTVKPSDKIGLAGRNGAGKSTLLKLIIGEDKATEGSITKPNDYTIGYLPQELKINSTKPIFEEAKSALGNIQEIERLQEKVSNEIITRTDYESDAYMRLIEQLNKLNDQLDLFGGAQADQQVEVILKGLGFTNEDLQKPINTFSGGWQMRVELSKILLKQPDLILLDEPTNHLDIDSIIWLENFLKGYNGSIVMVSHDKQFLDAITNRTIEIINQTVEDYKAPYSRFLQLREERIEKQIQAKKNQDREVARLQDNINKFRAKKNKAKFAQTLIKRLDRMDRIEVDSFDSKNMTLTFPHGRNSGKIVVEADQIGKSYGDKEVLRNISFTINKGDKVAFVGKNGMGKTTLAKIIIGELEHQGKIELGYNVDLGYYAQHQNQTLDGDITLLKTLEKAAPPNMQGKERGLLGAFLFSGEEVDKKVKVLSGGEKARLALAKMLLEPVNTLVLDEPTNHLDLPSKAILKRAVQNFKGTLIVVSHDRDFLSGLTDKVFEFSPGMVKEHLGDINDFLSARGAEGFRDFESNRSKVSGSKKEVSTNKVSYKEKKEQDKKRRKLEREIQRLEKEIELIEAEVKEIDDQLRDPEFYSTVSSDPDFFKNYESKKEKAESLFTEYEVASNALNSFNKKTE